MRHQRILFFPVVLGIAVLSAACAREIGAPGPEDRLATEEVGGPIDAELSTDEDPRGRRRSESSRVLPPGFPAELPLPAGVSVVESSPGRPGKSVVVFDSVTAAESVAVDWLSLLESEGWAANRSSDLAISATRGEHTISATVSPSGSGSRLRIVY